MHTCEKCKTRPHCPVLLTIEENKKIKKVELEKCPCTNCVVNMICRRGCNEFRNFIFYIILLRESTS